MKEKLVLVLILAGLSFNVKAQDGSDIMYWDEHEIDSTLVGEFIQIDFGRNSFGGLQIDTVNIPFEGEELRFKEFRQDTGFNNWFVNQYLESIKRFKGKRLRIEKMNVLAVDETSISVRLYARFFDSQGQAEETGFMMQLATFDRSSIHQILVEVIR